MRGRWGWALVALVSCASACDDQPDAVDEPSLESRDALWSGCTLLDDGRGCELTHRVLRIWFEEDDPLWRWTLDGQPVEPEVEAAEGGSRFAFGSEEIRAGGLLAAWISESPSPAFELRLVANPVDASAYDFGETVVDAADASHSERERVADALLSEEAVSPRESLARLHHARILRYDSGDPSGSAKAAVPALEREVELAAQLGFWGARCNATLALLFYAGRQEKLVSFERWSSLEAECRERSAGLGVGFDDYLVRHGLSMGAYTEAETRLERMSAVAARIQPEGALQAALHRITLYSRTGRRNEVRREVDALEASSKEGCPQAERDSWAGFARVRALQAGHDDLGDPRPGLRRALRAHQGPCQSVAWETYDWLKLGAASALMDDVDGLAEAVDHLESRTLEPKEQRQLAELRLERAVAEQRFDDIPALASQLDALLQRGEPEARWRFQMISAKAAERRDDLPATEQAYVAAEAVLDELWSDVASGTLRAHWLGSYRRSALGLVRTRLALGDLEGAACAARVARARALHPSGSSARVCNRPWTRSSDEAVFLILPETSNDWLVFSIDGDGVRKAASVRAPSSDGGWWDEWEEEIEGATQVRILASGKALRHGLHRERWRGRPLNQGRPVTFGLDLPIDAAKPGSAETALVLFSDADRYRSLRRYAPSVRSMADTLDRAGWTTRWEDEVDPSALSGALPSGGLFVYYGHGERVDLHGNASLSERADLGSTALLLAGDTRWGVDDASALEHVPRSAVLLGCDVGFPDPETWTGGLNLAHALLLAGTTEVLAATGPIDAATAARVGIDLLAAEPSTNFTLSRALHEVWGALPESPTDSALGPFRVWSR